MDMIVCNSINLREAQAELGRYLRASRESLIEDIATAKEFDPKSEADKALIDFDGSQRDWQNFVQKNADLSRPILGEATLPTRICAAISPRQNTGH